MRDTRLLLATTASQDRPDCTVRVSLTKLKVKTRSKTGELAGVGS
jgi:hypothetical protein